MYSIRESTAVESAGDGGVAKYSIASTINDINIDLQRTNGRARTPKIISQNIIHRFKSIASVDKYTNLYRFTYTWWPKSP